MNTADFMIWLFVGVFSILCFIAFSELRTAGDKIDQMLQEVERMEKLKKLREAFNNKKAA